MCAKAVKEESVEELCWAKEEPEPQRQLLAGFFNKPQNVLHRAGLFTFYSRLFFD